MTASNGGPSLSNETAPPPAPTRDGGAGAAALTLVLWALLIDMAVETFLSGAPVRWWVAGVVTAYSAMTALILSRPAARDPFGWSRRATASVLVFLGLMALTAWLPEGLTNGVRVLRQPTSVVLSTISALAVAAAGVVLVRILSLPWWGRIALSVLVLYGVGAFVHGIVESTPYPDLFRGESFWRLLPRWLQGAVVGAFFVVPVAICLDTARALRRRRLRQGRLWNFQQNVALATAVLIAFSTVARPTIRPAVTAGGTGDLNVPVDQVVRSLQGTQEEVLSGLMGGRSPRTLADLADRLDALWPIIEAGQRHTDRLAFDPSSVVSAVGREPATLFSWVRDETSLVPYRGALRGDVGVLMDRLGNSLDRALLLYRLFRGSGHTARLAHGTLSEEQARHIRGNLRPARAVDQPTRLPLNDGKPLLEIQAATQGIDTVAIRERIRLALEEEGRLAEAIASRAESQAQFIATAIRPYSSADGAAKESEDINDLRDHWWVQLSDSGAWVDFDPTLQDSEPGRALVQPRETVLPDANGGVPSDYLHTVGVRVVIEQWKNGRLREQQVLQRVFRPSERFGSRIALGHHAMRGPAAADAFDGTALQQQLERAVLAQTEWAPVLRLGSETIVQSSFTNDGEVNASPAAPLLGGSAQNLGRGIEGILGGEEFGRPGRPAGRSDGRLTAEWIEFEIHAPGRENRTIRRQIFDLLGPARRADPPAALPSFTDSQSLDRGLSLLGETEILPVVCRLPLEFVHHLTSTTAVANHQRLSKLLRSADTLDRKTTVSRVSELAPSPGRLYGLALARMAWSRFRTEVYINQPNILAFHKTLHRNSEGNIGFLEGFDIVVNDVAIHPKARVDPFAAVLEQGVLDTNVEAALAAGCQLLQSNRSGCTPVSNVAEAFAATPDPARDWVAIRSLDGPMGQTVVALPDARSRVEQDLRAGNIVVLRRASDAEQPFAGWWSIDPRTGRTIGIGDRGWGQSSSEVTAMIIGAVAFAAAAAQAYGCGAAALGVSDTKFALCLVCALIVGVLTAVLFFELLTIGVSTTAMGAGVFGTVSGIGCNLVSGGMS